MTVRLLCVLHHLPKPFAPASGNEELGIGASSSAPLWMLCVPYKIIKAQMCCFPITSTESCTCVGECRAGERRVIVAIVDALHPIPDQSSHVLLPYNVYAPALGNAELESGASSSAPLWGALLWNALHTISITKGRFRCAVSVMSSMYICVCTCVGECGAGQRLIVGAVAGHTARVQPAVH